VHYTWDVTFGQLIISVPLFWVVVLIMRIYQLLLRFRIEHEILMVDWAERNDKKLHELPTRTKWW
jgi:hypothetical protein